MAYVPLQGLTPTPGALLDVYPCFNCLSEKELLATLALVSYGLNHRGSTDVATMVADAKCWCIPDKEMLVAITASMVAIAIANGYFTDADAATVAASCLSCADPHILKAIITKATVENINAQWPAA